MIPKSKSKNPENQAEALSWQGNNFPPSIHKPRFNISCEGRPKVLNLETNNGIKSNNIILNQGLKMENTDSTSNASPVASLKVNYYNLSSFQTMSQSAEPMEDVEDSMISPSAKAARDARRAALESLGTPTAVRDRQAGEGGLQGHPGVDHQSPQQQMSGVQHSQVHASGGIPHGTQLGEGTRQDHPQRGDDSQD